MPNDISLWETAMTINLFKQALKHKVSNMGRHEAKHPRQGRLLSLNETWHPTQLLASAAREEASKKKTKMKSSLTSSAHTATGRLQLMRRCCVSSDQSPRCSCMHLNGTILSVPSGGPRGKLVCMWRCNQLIQLYLIAKSQPTSLYPRLEPHQSAMVGKWRDEMGFEAFSDLANVVLLLCFLLFSNTMDPRPSVPHWTQSCLLICIGLHPRRPQPPARWPCVDRRCAYLQHRLKPLPVSSRLSPFLVMTLLCLERLVELPLPDRPDCCLFPKGNTIYMAAAVNISSWGLFAGQGGK